MSESNGESSSANVRRILRPNLRNATIILPKTGERTRRNVTFREPELAARRGRDGEPEERTPLLRQSRSSVSRVGTLRAIEEAGKDGAIRLWSFATSSTGRGVFKCSLAYLLGSLATFLGPVAGYLGTQDGKHLTATVTVYFHPARSQGSMCEAVILALAAFAYAAFISFTSMGVSILLNAKLGMITLGHAIVLVVFCGGGLGLVGWIKQRLGNPLVNVSCSLASLAIITVLTKEGAVQAGQFSDDKVVQVMKMVLMGCLATTAVCFLISPVSARRELKINLIQVTDSFAEMLALITGSFLSGSQEDLQQEPSIKASERYRSVFPSLLKNLQEARYEHYVMGTEREYDVEARLVECMQRLAHGIGGLRSAASTQFTLLSQQATAHAAKPIIAIHSRVDVQYSFSPRSRSPVEGGDSPVEGGTPDGKRVVEDTSGSLRLRHAADSESDSGTVQSPAEIFSRFIVHLGPSLKSLAYTLKQILDELPYRPSPAFEIAVNSNFRTSLAQAIELHSRARREALSVLYKDNELKKAHSTEVEADLEEVAASCGHFSHSLEEFAGEMKVYLEILDDLKLEVDERPLGRSWQWTKFWRKTRTSTDPGKPENLESPNRAMQIVVSGTSDSEAEPHMGSDQGERTDPVIGISSPTERMKQETIQPQKPQQLAFGDRVRGALRSLARDDVKFAIKVGAGAALYALPSFVTSSRPLYQHWRGEWGLLSYMLVCSMTIGAANTTGYSRFLGTCIGAICAVVAWTASHGNAYALAFLGWLMSLWTSYIIVAKGKGPMGRFIMLTYNLSALYAYSLSVKDGENDDDEGGVSPVISEIVLHRVVAVLSGCLWGLVVTSFVWPISARSKFKDGLSLLWLRMGLIWKRDPLSTLLEGESSNDYMNLGEEFELQRFLSRLEALQGAAASEFELSGSFPDASYGRVLKSTSRMLDAFHAMNVLIKKNPTASEGEAKILRFTADERAQLCVRISHLFQGISALLQRLWSNDDNESLVLASSMKLEFPLNDTMPNTEHARDRLLAKIFCYRKNDGLVNEMDDEDFALLYAYALVTGQLSKEINEVSLEMEILFGSVDEHLLKLQ